MAKIPLHEAMRINHTTLGTSLDGNLSHVEDKKSGTYRQHVTV